MINFGPIGSHPIGGWSILDQEVVKAIELSSNISPDAKQAIKDFVKETYKNSWESFEELVSLSPPAEIAEYWELVVELVQMLIKTL